MVKPIVRVIPVQEATKHFRNAIKVDAAFDKARRFATGDMPHLSENHVEATHTATLQIPYTMRKLMSDNMKGVVLPLVSALKKGTQIEHSVFSTQTNRKGYLCDVFVKMGGMTGPCNLTFAIDAINKTNTMLFKSRNKKTEIPNIDRLIQISKSGEGNQWNAQATSISSFRDPRTGNLLSTDSVKPSKSLESHKLLSSASSAASSSSSSSTMDDDEQILLEMQEHIGKMCVADGVEFDQPKHIFQGKGPVRQMYDLLGAVTPKTLDVCAFKIKRTDSHTFVLAHSVLGITILGSDAIFTYQGKEDVLPTDELGYVLQVPNELAEKARESTLRKAASWEHATAHSVEDMYVRIRPGVTSWRLSEDEKSYWRSSSMSNKIEDRLYVDADEEFVFTVRLDFVQRHYHPEGCAAILKNFKDVWLKPIYNTRDVNFKTGEIGKKARSMVHLIDHNIKNRENELEIISKMSDEQALEVLKKSNLEIDEEGAVVPVASSSTSAAEDD